MGAYRNTVCSPPRRNRYFHGQLLSATDLQDEQTYFRNKQCVHNRLLHGSGIVAGLKVSIHRDRIRVESGFALDCAGRELCVPKVVEFRLPTAGKVAYLGLSYLEQAIKATPAMAVKDSSGARLEEATRIEEGFGLLWESSNTFSGHRRRSGRWQACGKEHSIPIARLRRSLRRWRLDSRFRPPQAR